MAEPFVCIGRGNFRKPNYDGTPYLPTVRRPMSNRKVNSSNLRLNDTRNAVFPLGCDKKLDENYAVNFNFDVEEKNFKIVKVEKSTNQEEYDDTELQSTLIKTPDIPEIDVNVPEIDLKNIKTPVNVPELDIKNIETHVNVPELDLKIIETGVKVHELNSKILENHVNISTIINSVPNVKLSVPNDEYSSGEESKIDIGDFKKNRDSSERLIRPHSNTNTKNSVQAKKPKRNGKKNNSHKKSK